MSWPLPMSKPLSAHPTSVHGVRELTKVQRWVTSTLQMGNWVHALVTVGGDEVGASL